MLCTRCPHNSLPTAVLSFPVALGKRLQHADPPHPIGLLRVRRERPRHRRAAEQRNGVAPFQLIKLHSIPASQGRIAISDCAGLRGTLGVAVHDQWIVYLPVLLVAIAAMVPAIIAAEKYRHMKGVFVSAVAALVISQIMLYFGAGNSLVLLAALVVFFSAFNVMEAILPSLITKVAPAHVKGTAMGLYSSLQFLGIFIGGIVGGFAHQRGGSTAVFVLTALLALIWLLVAAGMAQPSFVTTRLIPIAENQAADAEALGNKLRQVPGVVEAVIVADENLAYLKVDAKAFDAAQAEALARAV